MLSSLCVIAFLVVHVVAAIPDFGSITKECYVKLVPASNTLFLDNHDDVSIVCDASCFGRMVPGQVTWYRPDGSRVPRARHGRMFQMTYNRNMFSRLFLFDASAEEAGAYSCAVDIAGDVKRANIFLDISDGFIRQRALNAGADNRRGDVSILLPTLPTLHPARRRRALSTKGHAGTFFQSREQQRPRSLRLPKALEREEMEKERKPSVPPRKVME